MLKLKNVLMKPGVMLEYQDCPETPDPLKQEVYRSFVAKVPLNCNVLPHGPDVTWHTPQSSSHDFAHLQEHLTGQLCII
jgi:hypothetical protein